jgi:predicted DNA-binding WGR domain protein
VEFATRAMFTRDPRFHQGLDNLVRWGRIGHIAGASMKRRIILNATFLFAMLPSCFAQTATPATSTNKNDQKAQTKHDKKAAKANAKTTNKPATVAVTPSQEAAYALSRSTDAPKQTPPPPK